jgi:hypothetical protein
MTEARVDARIGASCAEKIILRYETVLWSLKEEVDWAGLSQEEAERARDWLREIRDRVDVLLERRGPASRSDI